MLLYYIYCVLHELHRNKEFHGTLNLNEAFYLFPEWIPKCVPLPKLTNSFLITWFIFSFKGVAWCLQIPSLAFQNREDCQSKPPQCPHFLGYISSESCAQPHFLLEHRTVQHRNRPSSTQCLYGLQIQPVPSAYTMPCFFFNLAHKFSLHDLIFLCMHVISVNVDHNLWLLTLPS